MQNISEVVELIEDIRASKNQLESKKAPKEFLFFLDLKKAFDTIDRALLLDTMDKKKLNRRLIAAVRNLYHDMKMEIDGE